MCRRRGRHFTQQSNDILFNPPDVAIDLFQRARRVIPVDLAVEIDLVANDAHLPIPGVALGLVDPGIGEVGRDLSCEEGVHILRQRHALGVAQIGVRLRAAVPLAADGRAFIAFGERGQNGLPPGRTA